MSRTITFTAQSSTFPYTLPSAGQAVAIGTNYPDDVRPTSEWTYSNTAYSLFNSFGAGVYVGDYSFGGAYVLAGTGGESAHPANNDAFLFDFADATWKRRPNTNSGTGFSRVPCLGASWPYTETNGQTYSECIYLSQQTPVPSASHPYRTVVPVSAVNGGGSLGSIVYASRAASSSASWTSRSVHRFDLATGLWSRLTNDVFAFASSESSAALDESTGRVFLTQEQAHSQNVLQHVNLVTRAISSQALSPVPTAGLGGRVSLFIHPTLRVMVLHRSDTMYGVNIDTPGASWTALTVTGLGASPAGAFNASMNNFVYYPPTGKFYWMPETGGNTLTRLSPPASNPLTNPWTVNTTTVSVVGGGTMPAYGDESAMKHYNALVYAEKTGCLAWVPGLSNGGNRKRVYLIKPSI